MYGYSQDYRDWLIGYFATNATVPVQNLTWFHELLDEKGNMSHIEFLEHIHNSGEISLQNFTDTLTEVVYPQCMVSWFAGDR